ncbi:MAG: hypothetical protein JOY98_07055 [Candidatus Eremiobacteraeota bacterium]|nr:hypothetical protein [Candidatus Eremiobacteraeota bacterium]
MRAMLYTTALAAAACAFPAASHSALCSVAAMLAEATPFLLAGACIERVAGRRAAWWPYAGCGCGPASARSLPAAALACLSFGPILALARLAAAVAIGHIVRRRACCETPGRTWSPLPALEPMLPGAIAGAIVSEALARVDVAHVSLPLQVAAGALLGCASPPCAVGSVAFAAALQARAPVAAAAFLCVAGIADIQTLWSTRIVRRCEPDFLSCVLTSLALGALAIERGGGLLHPAFAAALATSALAFIPLALVARTSCSPRARIVPALMLAGTLAAAPMPLYRATETTLAQLFAGERLSFTGQIASDGTRQGIVRYAITCCRADAAPVAVCLARKLELAPGSWVRVEGVVVPMRGELCLLPERVADVAAPADPFVYR